MGVAASQHFDTVKRSLNLKKEEVFGEDDEEHEENEEAPEADAVHVEGHYDYVDYQTRHRRVALLDQDAVHDRHVEDMKRGGRIRMDPLFLCSLTPAHETAMNVIKVAKDMAKDLRLSPDCLDKDWAGPDGFDPLECLFDSDDYGVISESLQHLADDVEHIMTNLVFDTLVKATLPAKIFGDLHGQFRDFLLLLHDFGFPDEQGPSYIFNGDWVDRGAHQLETVALVFALKVAFPDHVHLVRGNHEFVSQNVHMGPSGFKAACKNKLGDDGDAVFFAFHAAFEMLPLACLVENQLLVLHGGIGDGEWDLQELADAHRPIDDDALASNLHLYNVVWSDPIPETVESSFGVHDSPRDGHRHMVVDFGKDVTQSFCARNNIEMVIRSHQTRVGAEGYEVMHGNRLMRVFSARDYEGHTNDSCILYARQGKHSIKIRPQVLHSMMKVGARAPKNTKEAIAFHNAKLELASKVTEKYSSMNCCDAGVQADHVEDEDIKMDHLDEKIGMNHGDEV